MTRAFEQRCLNHFSREAACRCPVCRNYFCRECVTEHDDRLVCAGCLKKLQTPLAQDRRPVWQWIAPWGGLLLAWGCYAVLGWVLTNLS